MIDTSDIKKMVTHILRRQRGVPDREAIDPGREWTLGVVATMILVVLGGMISYSFYLNTISLEVDMNRVPVVAIPYNAAEVDQAVIDFKARADAYAAIRGTGVMIPVVSEPAATSTPSDLDEGQQNPDSLTDTSTSTESIESVPNSDQIPIEPAEDVLEVRPDLGV